MWLPDEPRDPGICGICGTDAGGEAYCSRECIEAEVWRQRLRAHRRQCKDCRLGYEQLSGDGRGLVLLFVEARSVAVGQSKERNP